MKYLAIVIRDENGKVIDVQNVRTLDAACSRSVVAAQSINPHDEQAASAYLTTLRLVSGLPMAHSAPVTRSSRQRVRCFQTGEIFPSAAAAARSIGVTTSAMTKHLRNPASLKALTAAAYTFERLST